MFLSPVNVTVVCLDPDLAALGRVKHGPRAPGEPSFPERTLGADSWYRKWLNDASH